MRRKHKEIFENGINRYYGLIVWRQCCICKDDFRRERGWSFIVGPYCNGAGRRYFLCKKCAPTKDAANFIALTLNNSYKLKISPPPGRRLNG